MKSFGFDKSTFSNKKSVIEKFLSSSISYALKQARAFKASNLAVGSNETSILWGRSSQNGICKHVPGVVPKMYPPPQYLMAILQKTFKQTKK